MLQIEKEKRASIRLVWESYIHSRGVAKAVGHVERGSKYVYVCVLEKQNVRPTIKVVLLWC